MLRVLNVSWNELNTERLYLPETATVVKEKEKQQNYDSLELPVSIVAIICIIALNYLQKKKKTFTIHTLSHKKIYQACTCKIIISWLLKLLYSLLVTYYHQYQLNVLLIVIKHNNNATSTAIMFMAKIGKSGCKLIICKIQL